MLQGRKSEQAAAAALVDRARAGCGGALVLRGLAGVGKSALLADVIDRSRDTQVLRTAGVESESPLAFAALHRLLRPAMRYAERLPEPQALALRAAFGEAHAPQVDRFLVFLATLSLLAEAAEHAPILAVVDDAHWLDEASAAALLFVARRLDMERVALVFAAREEDVREFDSGDLPRLVLPGVDAEAATALLAERTGVGVPAAVAQQLLTGTGGNPLALVELADILTPDQLTGRVRLPAPLPLTGGVEKAFLERARRLPEQAQTLLRVIAADDAGSWPLVRRAARSLGAGEDALDDVERADLLPNMGIAAVHLGDDEAALHHHDLLLTRARRTGALVMVLYALTRRGVTDLVTGRWSSATAAAEEALTLARSTGQPGLTSLPLTNLALLSALRGRHDVEQRLAAVDAVVERHPLGILDGFVHDLLRWARALQSGTQASYHHLSHITHPVMRHSTALARVEAAMRSGHRDVASAWVSELAEHAEATRSSWSLALLSHTRALLTDGAEAEQHYLGALQHHAAGSLRVFDRAQTQLAYGEHLRRARRRVDARTHLRAALETFTEIGAAPWADRAALELRASGETARRRSASTTTELTAQELQVAGLVQQGMSNREVAAQLFLSPRTIDFHLRNVFSKLGISSRAELARYRLNGAA